MAKELDNSTTSDAGTTNEGTANETNENLANEAQANQQGDQGQEAKQETKPETKPQESLLTSASAEDKQKPAEDTKTFIEDLPDSLKEDKALQTFKSVEDLAKSYVEARRMIGKKISDMTPEEISKFQEGVGVPDSPEGYDFGIKDTDDYNKELVDWYGNTSHELGIPQEKAKLMFEKYTTMQQEQQRLAEAQSIEAEKEQVSNLKKDWGAEFETRVDLAKKGIQHLGGDDLRAVLEESRLGNHPAFAKAFSQVGAMIAEDPSVVGKSASKFGMTPEDAKGQLEKFEIDNKTAIYNRRDPDHKWAIEKRHSLYKLAGSTK